MEVAIDYIKSPDFRIVWADGVVGSATPNGLIHFALYAERPAIPDDKSLLSKKLLQMLGNWGLRFWRNKSPGVQ